MNKSKDAQRLERRKDVWTKRCEGWSQQRIADELDVNQSTISRDLAWMAEQVTGDLKETITQTKLEQLGQLEYMVNELLDAWRQSKEAARRVSRTTAGAKSKKEALVGRGERTSTTVSDRVGESAYLREARAAMADIRRILGADAPLKVAPTTPDGESPYEGGVVILTIPDNGRGDSDWPAARAADAVPGDTG